MKRFTLLIFFFVSICGGFAQSFSVKSFQALPMDMTASSLEGRRIDQNGEVAALIKIVTSETGFTFEAGSLGIVDSKQEIGEVWVWVPKLSKKITIKHQQLGVLRDYRYPIEIEAQHTYEMVLTTGKVITTIDEEVHEQFLLFQISPPDAMLEVDDQVWPVSPEGTAKKLMNFGTYTYRVQAQNYHPEAGKVTVDNPDEAKTVEVTLQPNFGWIEVSGDGNLKGAAVYIDNTMAGKAPFKSDVLKSGNHTVKIVREMYEPYSTTVTVNDNETTQVKPELAADFAHVTLQVDADAEIWVNDEKKGIGTWTGDLSNGIYKMESRQANHEPAVTRMEINSQHDGENIRLETPTPIYGSLVVESTPDNAKLFIDGKEEGNTPKLIGKQLIGNHEVKLTKEGYGDYVEMVTIVKGERKQVIAKLDKLTTIPEGALPGEYSVSATKKVFFSKGNLQYQASTKKWRFAPNTWDAIGEENSNVSEYYSGWIDLFGWGTGNDPVKNSPNKSDYTKFTDWGSKYGDDWRTLTKDEWDYILEQRNTVSGIRYAKATVNDVHGLIILPDHWNSDTYRLNATNDGNTNYKSNIISASIWNDLFASVGAVFLPTTGKRSNETTIIYEEYDGEYWSSSLGREEGLGYCMEFSDKSVYKCCNRGGEDGRSVRLVHDFNENAYKMDWQALSVPKPVYASLNLQSIPDNAKILIDSMPFGETPNLISKLLIGQHEIKLTKDGYADYTESFVIARDERKIVDVTLRKSQENPETAKSGYMKILKVEFGNKDNLWIDTYGSDLYYSDMRYLMPKITYVGLSDHEREVSVDVKIFAPGKTTCETSNDSPKNYTLSSQINVYNNKDEKVTYLEGWGNSIGNYYVEGTWRYEIWYEGKLVYETTFEIKPDAQRPKNDKLPDSKMVETNAIYRYELGKDKYNKALRNNTNQAEAERWYLESAEMGYCWAQEALASLYEDGNGVKKDDTEAAKWRLKAAEQGARISQYLLGNMYFEGRGVKQDYTEAVKWYRKVLINEPEDDATSLIPQIQNNLGWCYQNGYGVKKNIDEALNYYRSSAEKNNCDGLGNLAYMYENGIGVKKNLEKAKELYLKVEKGDCGCFVGGLGHGREYVKEHAKVK